MVGIVVVSHSDVLAEGVVRLAREMASPELSLEAAGGIEEPGVLGTDADRVRAAIERAMSPDGVLVMMDLGSALMSAEFAVELLVGAAGPIKLSAAPLVEGTVAAAVAASGGASLDEVAAEASGALAMKASQVEGGPAPKSDGSGGADPGPAAVRVADAVAELPVRNAIGLHARPAARFVETARSFDAEVFVGKAGAGDELVSARSLTNLVALGARQGDTIVVSASGAQAQEAVDALRELADAGFGDGLEDGAPATRAPSVVPVPEPERAIAMPEAGAVLAGVAASAGVAVGAAHLLGGGPAGPPPERPPQTPQEERAQLERGLASASESLARDRDLLGARAGGAEAEIFDAHLALLADEALLEPARTAIDAGATAERSIYDAAQQVAAIYRGLPDALLAERGTDVLDVGQRVVAAITGTAAGGEPASGVVIADELTPTQSAGFDPELVKAIATARGSTTAHAAIIARSLGIPAVVGLGAAVLGIAGGTTVLLDGDAGALTVSPPSELVDEALSRQERQHQRAAAALARSSQDARLASGERIEVFANIGNPGDAVRAVEFGAEGVGMLRTEFLYLDRSELPDEDEQFGTFLEIARTLNGRPLIVRTLDAGADKPLPGVPMPAEANPFLGVRGIRVGLQQPAILRAQLRAALRVAVDHPVKVMMPMVATVSEVLATRAILDEARGDLGIDAPMEVGITLEVPSAAVMAERFGRHLDFFSLGTNDLTQYTMAAERGDARLSSLLASPQPAVLRLVKLIVEGASAASAESGRRCWVGVCGEMGGDPASGVLLAGLGVTELSMAPGLIPEMKETLRGVSLTDARAAAEAALDADDAPTARGFALELI
jgi:multiphosphoryl transfer protein